MSGEGETGEGWLGGGQAKARLAVKESSASKIKGVRRQGRLDWRVEALFVTVRGVFGAAVGGVLVAQGGQVSTFVF